MVSLILGVQDTQAWAVRKSIGLLLRMPALVTASPFLFLVRREGRVFLLLVCGAPPSGCLTTSQWEEAALFALATPLPINGLGDSCLANIPV